MKTTIKLLGILLLIMLNQSCSKDKTSGCGDPITTYYRNIDTINIPYKTGKSFEYKDKNGTLITTNITRDTTFFNCILEQVSNPNCGTRNTSCYITKQFYFDTLINLSLTNKNQNLFLNFNNSIFNIDIDAVGSKVFNFYPLFDSIIVNNKPYYLVSMIINDNSDTLYINNKDGIVQLINNFNIFKLQ